MKKIKEVKVPAKKASTKKVEIVYCDIPECNAKITYENYDGGGGQCQICKRDVCKKHKVRDWHDGGDYADSYCAICAKLFIAARDALEEQHWKEEEALERRVKKVSLAVVNPHAIDTLKPLT